MSDLLRRLRREERGIALVLALGVTLTLAIAIIAVIEYTSNNSRAASISASQLTASDLAEAGVNAAYSVLNYWDPNTNTGNNAADPTLLGCNAAGTSCTPACVAVQAACPSPTSTGIVGTATYSGAYDSTAGVWTITGTGYARNPTGAATIEKTTTASVSVTWNNTQPANATAWDYAFATGTTNATTCDVMVPNSVVIDSPLYVAGNLCLTNSASVQEATDPVTLNVRGKVAFSNSSFVGTSAKRLTAGTVVGGCGTSLTSTHPCSSATDPYWVTTNSGQAAVTPPTLTTTDMDDDYAKANPGPLHPCSAGRRTGGYPTFDNDGTRNGTAPSFNLTPGSSYTCRGYDANGNLVGELSWDVASHTLTIRGTMYIDGLVTSTDSSATYAGSATLYASSFNMANSAQLCANTGCNFATWNPNSEMLLIVATGSGTAISLSNSVKFQGGFFTNATIAMSNSVTLMGPMIGGDLVWGNSVTVQPLPAINTLPIGAPGAPNVHAQPGLLGYTTG